MKAKSGKRPTQVKIQLPPEELEEVRSIAKAAGLTLSGFVKMSVRKEIRKIKRGM